LIDPEDDDGSDDNGAHESVGAAVISHGDPAPILQFAEHDLDAMALSVEGCVVGMLDFAVLSRRDARHSPTRSERGSEVVAVIATIGNEVFGLRQVTEHQTRSFVVAHLTLRQQQDDGTAFAVTNGM